ncbi:MAG: hypothetical protein EOM23_07440 [Candidatus Moranbacteria bacterium]|nr:hypothetical protein [Candidatus Moranbacteria bacterium]
MILPPKIDISTLIIINRCFNSEWTNIPNIYNLPPLFDRFYRSDPARGRQQGGTGLGLSIAKWIVDRHNGYFEVLSHEEFGTRISIHLPPIEPDQL